MKSVITKALAGVAVTGGLVFALTWNGGQNLANVQDRVSELVETIQGLNSNRDDLMEVATDLQTKYNNLVELYNQKVQELEDSNGNNAELEAEIEDLLSQITDLQDQLDEVQSELATQTSEMEKANAELEKANAEAQEHEDNVNSMVEEVEGITASDEDYSEIFAVDEVE